MILEYGLEGTIGGLSGSGYAMYRLEGTTWKRIGATDFPSEFDHPNFLIYPEFLFEEKAEPLSLVSEGRVFVVNPGPQMPNGSLVSLAQKSLVSYPLYSHDGRSTFTLTPENLDKGHRQKCKGDGTPCIEIENGLDESFGRSPIQVEARPN